MPLSILARYFMNVIEILRQAYFFQRICRAVMWGLVVLVEDPTQDPKYLMESSYTGSELWSVRAGFRWNPGTRVKMQPITFRWWNAESFKEALLANWFKHSKSRKSNLPSRERLYASWSISIFRIKSDTKNAHRWKPQHHKLHRYPRGNSTTHYTHTMPPDQQQADILNKHYANTCHLPYHPNNGRILKHFNTNYRSTQTLIFSLHQPWP